VRQHPFGRYIGDFHCAELKLVDEIGGNVHPIAQGIFWQVVQIWSGSLPRRRLGWLDIDVVIYCDI